MFSRLIYCPLATSFFLFFSFLLRPIVLVDLVNDGTLLSGCKMKIYNCDSHLTIRLRLSVCTLKWYSIIRTKREFGDRLVDIFCILSRLPPHLVYRSVVFSDNTRFFGTCCILARVIKLDNTSSKMIVQRICVDFTHTFVNIERAIVLFAQPLIPCFFEAFDWFQ